MAKCHGNRKLQHFKRKCRLRGLNEDEIMKLILKRTHERSEPKTVNKRKRSSPERVSKKMKISSNSNDGICFYKPSKYLKMPRKILLHSLRLQLKCPIKRKKEQQFIIGRLGIVDRQFCLQQIHDLFQTYSMLGIQYRIWPVS